MNSFLKVLLIVLFIGAALFLFYLKEDGAFWPLIFAFFLAISFFDNEDKN